METWQTFGHEAAKSILEKQLNAKRFAHAYLFQGPEGVGKKKLALELAERILGAKKLENHPDYQILDNLQEITIEQVRNFIAQINLKPFIGEKRVAIINNAHNLNLQSANALLKTLEEPSDSTVMILISSSGRMLKTIVSRCQVFNFQSFSLNQLKDYAQTLGSVVSDEILTLSFGQPSRLKQLIEDKDFLSSQQTVVNSYQQLLKKRAGEKLLAVSEMAEMESDDLQKQFQTWMNWQQQQLTSAPQNVRKLSALADAITALQNNQNKKIVLQSLVLKI